MVSILSDVVKVIVLATGADALLRVDSTLEVSKGTSGVSLQ
jgi:hypothetical protein